jgi:hypothetical protein
MFCPYSPTISNLAGSEPLVDVFTLTLNSDLAVLSVSATLSLTKCMDYRFLSGIKYKVRGTYYLGRENMKVYLN